MIVLRKYQRKKVDELRQQTNRLLTEFGDVLNKTIVFQAPTGSGKTIMMAHYIQEYFNIDAADESVCFLWLSIGKGKVHEQSKKSLDKFFKGDPSVSLYEESYLSGASRLEERSVTVVNWEKLNNKDGETKEWKNKAMKKAADFHNFTEVMRNTREESKLILIIDESHIGKLSDNGNEIRAIIGADLTIEVSATPTFSVSREQEEDGEGAEIRVKPKDVIDEEMIKDEIVINEGLTEFKKDDTLQTGEDLILETAFKKRETLKNLFLTEGVSINPLVLIQLPSSAAGEAKRDYVTTFLKKQGVTEDNGQLAVWLSDDKVNLEDDIAAFDSKVSFLMFKVGVATGWDCPRAHILVMFRDLKKEAFKIQTIGRILRMPEQKYYKATALNKGYVYANATEISVTKELYEPDILKNVFGKKREGLPDISLESYYRKRTDFGVLTMSFDAVLHETFNARFQLKNREGVVNPAENAEILQSQGFNLALSKNETALGEDGRFKTALMDTLDGDKPVMQSQLTTHISQNDIQAKFDELIVSKIGGYAQRDSMATMKRAIYYWFEQNLGIGTESNGKIDIQHIVMRTGNLTHFSLALAASIEAYEPIRKKEVAAKAEEEWYAWQIKETESYDTEGYSLVKNATYYYDKCYLWTKRSQIEKDFEDYLETEGTRIQFWYKNGVSKKEYFGIKYTYKNEDRTFYPDYIVLFKDNRIGIFDTKGGMTETSGETKAKAEALQAFIEKENAKGQNLFGGIIVLSKQSELKLNQQNIYFATKEKAEEWVFVRDVF
jgi:type III restriction enzyme